MGNKCFRISGRSSEETDKKTVKNDQNTIVITNVEQGEMLGAESLGDMCSVDLGSEKDNNSLRIILLPHQHTAFCERKQRVCSAVGKLQEFEMLKVNKNEELKNGFEWIRLENPAVTNADGSITNYTVIESSQNSPQYQLMKADVNHFITIRFKLPINEEILGSSIKTDKNGYGYMTNVIGPILPGPPRVLDFKVSGSMKVNGFAIADNVYIGGYEGQSQYWWMKVSAEGIRTQITEPKQIPLIAEPIENILKETDASKLLTLSKTDPRVYKITPDDEGCTLKAKCKPTRVDFALGEIFTSKGTEKITI